MKQDSSSRSFAEYLADAPLATGSSAKLVLTGEVRRSANDGKFVFTSPEVGTVEFDVAAVEDFEPVDGGLTRITLDALYARDNARLQAGASSGGGLVPFVMATPHHASITAIRDQIRKAEASAAILDVETAFIKDVWGDDNTNLIKDVSSEETIPVDLLK